MARVAALLTGTLLFTNCQCLQPVTEGTPELQLDARSAQAFLDSLVPAFICGQAAACHELSSHVTCDDLVNAPGQHRGSLWNAWTAAALDAGAVTYDPDAGQACLQRLQLECGIPSCSRDALTGHRAQGEPCAQTVECRSGLWCPQPDTGCPRCAPLPANGDETPDSVTCPEGVGALTDGGFRCHAFAHAGESCALAADESWSVRCARPLVCVSGSCTAPLPEGAACAGAQCELGLGCAGDGRCRRLGDVGDACPCLRGLECRAGACALLRAEGEACRFSSDCRAPFSCRAGVCARAGGAGAGCATPYDCEGSLLCLSNGTCGAPAGQDAPCSAQADCALGLACSQGRCRLNVCQ